MTFKKNQVFNSYLNTIPLLKISIDFIAFVYALFDG